MAKFIGNIKASLGLDTGAFSKNIGKSKKELKGFEKSAKDFSSNIKGYIAGAFTIGAMTSFAKQVIDVTGQFQRLEAVLTNTLGSSSAAQESMQMISDFASKTPFSVSQLTESFVKLANQGFKPTADEMTKLGDLASSTGKGFDQLTEAIIDAQTGEFERLKEFGIRAEKQGDKVTFAFKGVKTQTDFTADSIRQYVLSLGDAEGVSGSMAAISETLEGKISNLGDSWESMLNTIGSRSTGILNTIIDSFKGLVDEINETEKATQRASELGFGRKLFSEVDGLGAKMLVFDETFQKAISTMYNSATSADTLKRQVRALKEQYDNLNKNTDEGRAKAIIYADGIKKLTDRVKELSVNNTTAQATTKQLTKEQIKAAEQLKKAREGLDFSVSAVGTKGLKLKEEDLPAFQLMEGIDKLPSVYEQAMATLQAKIDKTTEAVKGSAQAINDAFMSIVTGGLATFGMALGTAFAGGDVMAIGQQFAGLIADAIGGLGQKLIELGVVMSGIMEALSAGGFANPALLIGGGIALVALSQAMKGMMSSPVAFANGGLVTGATMGLVGEGRGTTRSNPEVIAPLDKLQNFMPQSSGGGGAYEFIIKGDTLVASLNRNTKTQKYSR